MVTGNRCSECRERDGDRPLYNPAICGECPDAPVEEDDVRPDDLGEPEPIDNDDG
jgi:hypothetical protein